MLDTVELIVDFTVILSVLNLHRTTFKDTTVATENQVARPVSKKIVKKGRSSAKPLPSGVLIEDFDASRM